MGVIVDHKLSWTPHIKQRTKEVKAKLVQISRAIQILYGPKGKHMRWIYTGMVRPALTYGAIVWSRACQKVGITQGLGRINRLASLIVPA